MLYPDCPVVLRTVEVGGLTRHELHQKLHEHSIFLNEYAERLLTDNRFIPSVDKYSLQTVELTVADLGFPDGATTPEIYKVAGELGLELCPIELGPHLRIAYIDQPEARSEKQRKYQAPTGSITIASEILSEDDEFPKGFYLRTIEGKLWLRGYRADDLHVWNPGDRLVFVKP